MPLVNNLDSTLNIQDIATKSSPKTAWDGVAALNFKDENIDNQNVKNILRAIHGEGHELALYCKTFPLIEEQEELCNWIANLTMDDQGNFRNPKLIITAHFTDIVEASRLAEKISLLMDNQKDSPTKENEDNLAKALNDFTAKTVGFMVSEVYNENTTLVNYAIRNKEFVRFPAINMIEHQLEQCGKTDITLWEANDPTKTPFFDENGKPDYTVDIMIPERRIKQLEEVYKAKAVKLKWVQPPLSPEKEMCDTLILYTIPDDGKINLKQKTEALLKFVNKFYETFPIDGKFKSDLEYSFSDDGKLSAPEKFAKYCEEMSKEISRIIPEDIIKLSEKDKEIVEMKILLEARKLSYKNLSADDFKIALNEIIDEDEIFKSFNTDAKKAILDNSLTLIRDELAKTAQAVNGMVDDLKIIIKDPVNNFYDTPKFDERALAEAMDKLRKFEAMQAIQQSQGYLQRMPQLGPLLLLTDDYRSIFFITARGVVNFF